jgi:hypothetical protein
LWQINQQFNQQELKRKALTRISMRLYLLGALRCVCVCLCDVASNQAVIQVCKKVLRQILAVLRQTLAVLGQTLAPTMRKFNISEKVLRPILAVLRLTVPKYSIKGS